MYIYSINFQCCCGSIVSYNKKLQKYENGVNLPVDGDIFISIVDDLDVDGIAFVGIKGGTWP
jgi:hypothetical protein